jgi:ATP-dependent helicase/nuclease subunit A
VSAESFAQAAAAVEGRFADDRMESVAQLEPVPLGPSESAEKVERALGWRDPNAQASALFSKTSVSELKRLADLRQSEDEEVQAALWLPPEDPGTESPGNRGLSRSGREPSLHLLSRRPKFVEERKMNAAERGTVYHAVMQHVPLVPDLTEETVRRTMDAMVERELLTAAQRAEVEPADVFAFFRGELGQRMLRASRVFREVPFSYGLRASEVYPDIDPAAGEETVLVQGVIDCLFEEGGALVLLDYKTDALYGDRLETLTKRYSVQLGLYARAIESIWKRPVTETYLYFFDGAHLIKL